MNSMERKMRQQARRFESNDGLPKGWHSKAYHRYFEGYSEYMVENAAGKPKIQRVYTANWYRIDLDKKTKAIVWTELLLCWAGMLLLFLFAGTRNIQINKCSYMALIQAAMVACMVWDLSGIFHLLTLPERSTVGQYRKSFESTRKSSIGLLMTFGAAVFGTFFQLIIGCEDFLLHLLCAGLYGIGLLLALVINRLNANLPFEKLANTATAGESAAVID